MKRLHIDTIGFEDGALIIRYMREPEDARLDGHLIQSHQIQIAKAHPNYSNEIQDLEDLATSILAEALDDFESSDPFVPTDVEDDESNQGMGWG